LLSSLALADGNARAVDVPSAPTRPRICLVLSGGGARGAGHVGVLKALEKLHIPVDCIAGTSIGAAIGGLYAAGMAPEEIERQLNRPEVQADMADNPPRSSYTYRSKQDQLKYLLRVEFGYSDGRFFFPRGLITGGDPDRILNVLSLALEPDTDFDKLPVPFRAVATDIETGDAVVLSHGSLAEAMRASMAVPGLYPPVSVDNRLLVDGGLTRNLPVDVARQMGADVVIAVNIGTPLAKGEELNDFFSVSLQVLKILGNQNVDESIQSLTDRDVLVQPDLKDIGASDFDRMGEAIMLGEQESLKSLSPLTELQLSPEGYAHYRETARRLPSAPARVDFVEVDGNERIPSDQIRARFGVSPGESWDQQAIDQGLQNLYNLGYFQSVDAVVVHKNGQTGLELAVSEKAWQPSYVDFGLHITDDFEGSSRYELLGGYTRSDVDDLGAEWRNEFAIGNTRYYYTELYQPVDDAGRFFVAPEAEYLNATYDLFSGEKRIAEYSTVFPHGGVDFGMQFDNAAELRLGLLYGHAISQPRIGDPTTLPSYRNTLVGSSLRLNVDTFDSPSFPTQGTYLLLNGFFPRRSLGSDISYNRLHASLGQAFGDDSDAELILAEAGSNLGSSMPPYEQFTLGGFLSLAGQRQGQLRGDKVADLHFIYTHHVASLPPALGKGLYFGAGLDAGNVWQTGLPSGSDGLLYGASAFVGADTALGPLYLGLGAGKDGNRVWFLYLGIPINGNTLAPSFGN